MPDNWNNLADLLGTPSMDPFQRRNSPQKPAAPANEPTHAEVEPQAPISRTQHLETAVAAPTASSDSPASNKPKRKSTWDAVAEFFGVAPAAEEESVGNDEPIRSDSNFGDRKTSPAGSQSVADSLLARKPTAEPTADDLDSLLAGFRSPPRTAVPPPNTPAKTESRVARKEADRDVVPSARGRHGNDDSRDTTSTRRPSMFVSDSEPERVSSRPERTPRTVAVDMDAPRESRARNRPDSRGPVREEPRVESTRSESIGRDDLVESGNDQPDRRGPRRRPRRGNRERESQELSRENSPAHSELDSDAEITNRPSPTRSRDDALERPSSARTPSRNDDTRRERPRRDDSARPSRSRSGSTNDGERASEPRSRDFEPQRAARTSAWDEPLDIDETDLEPIEAIDSESAPAEEARRRRRRRKPRATVEDDAGATTGRQIYGRHADDEPDTDGSSRSLSIVPWVDAISVIVNKNMENHRNHPAGNRSRNGRGGGGHSDRRR